MASAFGHAFASTVLGTSFPKEIKTWKFFLLGAACAILPDADVIGFGFGIAYGDFWGHRGFSHSLVFAAFIGVLVPAIFYRKDFFGPLKWALICYFFLCTASHSLLDALTTGGLGVAFFSPFDNGRYFFPWRPIQVSPIGAANFFGEAGVRVLKSEAIWIGIPGALYVLFVYILNKIRTILKP